MKKITLLLICSFFIQITFSQGNSVATADQFCSGGSGLVFPNVTGNPNDTDVGCLYSIPNPAYYFLQIEQPGDLFFTISQETATGTGLDVDFISWGPFPSLAAANAAITLTACTPTTCPNNTTDPTFYPYATDDITDCSFSIAPTEDMTINSGLSGQIYVVLITNFSDNPGFITLQQTGGTGTTSCADIPVCGGNFYDSGGNAGSYSNNETTTTTIYPDTVGGTVTVDFTTFNVLSGDNLTVYNGPDNTFPSLGAVTSAPASFSSTDATGTLTFVFSSDASGVSTGWETDVTCTTPPPPPTCGTTFYDIGGSTRDYLNNETTITTISPTATGGTVTVDFTTFNILGGDVLTVYDGPDATSPSLGNVTSAPSSFSSTNTYGELTFVFTSNSAGTSAGWEADVSCTIPPTCSSFFFDSGGPTGAYTDNELTTTTFFPDIATEAITVTFTAFDLEYADDLYVYDGPNNTSTLLGVFNGTTVPGPFTSSHPTGALTFVFDSDYSVSYDGWEASISCAPYVPPVVCGTIFYDSGGASGDYSYDELTTTTFIPDISGTSVTATFTAFDTEVDYDELSIYDGPDATHPLLGTFSGTGIPGPFTSSDPSGALTFVFESDFLYNNEGWAADLSCTSTCNLIITDTNYPISADACNLNYTELTTNAPIPSGEAIVFSESFNGASFPAGWATHNGTASLNWNISNTNNAGGTPREAHLEWIAGNNTNNWRLTSPAIDITGQTNLQLSFKHELDILSNSNISIRIQTSLDGTTWTNQYTDINIADDINATIENVDLSSLDGNTTMYFRFRLNGPSFDLNDWYIDDIVITADGTPTPPQITWTPNTGLYTDSSLTTAYAGGFSETVYSAPSGTQVYTATDQNGCTDTVSVTNNSKTWNGSIDTNWYVHDNWTPSGVPTLSDCVLIPDIALSNNRSPIADNTNIPTGIPIPPILASALNLTVDTNGYVEILSGTNLQVMDWIHLDGIIDIRDSGSLIQVYESGPNINNNTGNGIIHMQRTVPSGVNSYDYIYWSSPTDEDFNVTDISAATGELIYEWNPTLNGVTHGDWIAASGNMSKGKGYIVRGLVPDTGLPTNTTEFSGKPQNGMITVPINRGTHTSGPYTSSGDFQATNEDDNWNLIGNPYPSAISYTDFIAANPNIDGTIYFWTHQTAPSYQDSPFYYDFIYNYSDEYIDNNFTGSNPATFGGDIAAGQAFFVLMLDNATQNEDVIFNNSMRNETLINSNFYRTNKSIARQSSDIERHRIWLDLIAPNEIGTSILVGYVEGATNNNDRLYDGYEFAGGTISFYSLIEEEKMSIQGKALPFENTDMVPLGIVIPENGNYSIAINTLDGLFQNTDQAIFIEDTYTNTIHNLRINPFSFNINAGTYNDRFILRYTDQDLSIDEFEVSGLEIIAPSNSYIKVKSGNDNISTVIVYDLLGRALMNKTEISASEIRINNPNFSEGTYMVKAILSSGKQKIQKVVLKH